MERKQKTIKISTLYVLIALFGLLSSIFFLMCIQEQEQAIETACYKIETHADDAIEAINSVYNLNAVNHKKETMLMVAAKNANQDAVQHLLYSGANPNFAPPNKQTPLELYCQYGKNFNTNILSLLIDANAFYHVFMIKPPIYHLLDHWSTSDAKEKEQLQKDILLLVDQGAHIEYQKTSLLHEVAKINNTELFIELLKRPNVLKKLVLKDGDENTPYDVAVQYGAYEIQQVIRTLAEAPKEPEATETPGKEETTTSNSLQEIIQQQDQIQQKSKNPFSINNHQ